MNSKHFLIIAACVGSPNVLHAAQIVQQQVPEEPIRWATEIEWQMFNEAKFGKLTKEHLQIYLKNGADINIKSFHGNTPLIRAVRNGHKEVVQTLIAANAHINERDYYGRTALSWAAEQDEKDIVQLLIAENAVIDKKCYAGYTPLMNASSKGHVDVAQLLIAAGANINATKYFCPTTALINAARNGHNRVVQLLVAAGVDIDAKDCWGTARDYAKDKAAYDEAVVEGLKECCSKAKILIEEQQQLIPVISDIITGYAYGPSLIDLPAINEPEEKELDANVTQKNKSHAAQFNNS